MMKEPYSPAIFLRRGRAIYLSQILTFITVIITAAVFIHILIRPSAEAASQSLTPYDLLAVSILLDPFSLFRAENLYYNNYNNYYNPILDYTPLLAALSYRQKSTTSSGSGGLTLSGTSATASSSHLLSLNLPFGSSAITSRSNSQSRASQSYSATLQGGGYSPYSISNIDFLNLNWPSSRAFINTFFSPALANVPLGALSASGFPFSPFTPFFTGALTRQSAVVNGSLISWPLPGLRRVAAVASLVLANPPYGMYCWDPVGWLNGGFQVRIWEANKPVLAQSFDARGSLLDVAPSFSVQPTGQTGTMTLKRADILLYEGLIDAAGPVDYLTTVSVDAASTLAVTHRRSATCDSCHPTPPGHIANPALWGKCNLCHILASVIHVHAYNANIAIDDCYRCHPTGCLSGLHGQIGLWCTNCHGNLADAPNNKMWVSGQLGKPYCANCHDQLHSENLPALFMDSAGHGGVWCINCHNPTHVEKIKPFGYSPLGYNNCQACHTVQATESWMGPNCGICHGSSVSPHLVNR